MKGRSIHEHVALAHELFQKLRTKVSDGAICMKLDISKAFDKLHWSFLFKALDFFKFPPRWINWIEELICTFRGSILINKSPCGFFGTSCGLRHSRRDSQFGFGTSQAAKAHNSNLSYP